MYFFLGRDLYTLLCRNARYCSAMLDMFFCGIVGASDVLLGFRFNVLVEKNPKVSTKALQLVKTYCFTVVFFAVYLV